MTIKDCCIRADDNSFVAAKAAVVACCRTRCSLPLLPALLLPPPLLQLTFTSLRTTLPLLVRLSAKCFVTASLEGYPTYRGPGPSTFRNLQHPTTNSLTVGLCFIAAVTGRWGGLLAIERCCRSCSCGCCRCLHMERQSESSAVVAGTPSQLP